MNRQLPTPSCPEPATAEDLALLDSHFASAKAAAKSTTLVRGQSINLTTGVVTEGDDEDFAPAKIGNSHIDLPGHRQGLRMNDLESLHSAILINADSHLIKCARFPEGHSEDRYCN